MMIEKSSEQDIDVIDFARAISMLPANTPISAKFDNVYGQKDKRWFSSSREHLVGWALHYPVGGVKGFKHVPSNSFRQLYQHFARPEALLWLAESLGENEKLLQRIVDKVKNEKSSLKQCSIVRQYIPVERILELLVEKGLL